ncbi:unnamed protein product [Kuraishia capsulata CBS 1993]|uniref:Uncharacterized protein n=1 Tax=Kuraishia capsulata CBS 1993 TaxID=1382522 RepID=W6MFY6_9ASCO|nr:uncharacterized protein KUCA_T00000542001 [Kuraishia capsulata CBS 1993]CDK24576.1 unnamed protein product [Kuraishia capsulata CBS 1993]
MSSLRKPLASKDVNQRASPSPSKAPHKHSNSPFTIYKDETDYRVNKPTGRLGGVTDDKENTKITRQRSHSPSKESPKKRRERVAGASRSQLPLQDLDIRLYPGYIQYHDTSDSMQGILQPKTQLTSSWMVKFDSQGRKIKLPSYLTPPRKDRTVNLQYVTSLDADVRTEAILRKRSSSLSQHAVKRLDFTIYEDHTVV